MYQKGFSLVELIITLIVLGILVITVVPKFFTAEVFDSYTTRDRIMNALRVTQQRAMHNTGSSCHKLYFTNLTVAPPSPDNCSSAIDIINNPDYLIVAIDSTATSTTISRVDGTGVSFSQMTFDEMGTPSTNCINTCQIDLGEAKICISGVGAIYAC